MSATIDCPYASSSLWLSGKPWDVASSRRVAHRLLSDSDHAYYLCVSLKPVQHMRLSGPDKGKESCVRVPAPEAGWRNTLRWGVERGDATSYTQGTYWVHPQGVYECVWFGSRKRVCLAISVVVEVTGEREDRKRGGVRGEESEDIGSRTEERIIKIIAVIIWF